MPRTITDQEEQFIKSRMQVADFVESIYNDPQLNKEAKRLIKKKYPEMQIPDLDIEDRVEQRFAEEQKRRDDAEAVMRKEADDKRWQDERQRTKDQYGFTDEAMGRLEKMMVERNIGDYEVAAQYLASKEPKPTDADFNTGRWDFPNQPGFADIAKDPEGWGRNEILKALRADQERTRGGRF
jgi:hypothetical protein